MTYLNTRTCYGVETLDEISRDDFNSYKDYAAYVRQQQAEHAMTGVSVYASRRCAKIWKA